MTGIVGTFAVDDSFHITGRGLVLLGEVSGQVAPGYQLIFKDGTHLNIGGVEAINKHNQYEKMGLLVDMPLTPRDELLRRGIVWGVAQIFAP